MLNTLWDYRVTPESAPHNYSILWIFNLERPCSVFVSMFVQNNYVYMCFLHLYSALIGGCTLACAVDQRVGSTVLNLSSLLYFYVSTLFRSFLMSVFHNGLLRTMKANYTVL